MESIQIFLLLLALIIIIIIIDPIGLFTKRPIIREGYDMRKPAVIIARFKGRDKSMGFSHGMAYRLNTYTKVIDGKMYFCIQDTENKNIICPYLTRELFDNNWKVIFGDAFLPYKDHK